MVDEQKPTSEVDDWLDDAEESDDFSGELDQGDIDDLLGSGLDEQKDNTGDSEDSDAIEELDQDNIDALLGGSLDETPGEGTEDDDSAELDQANIDALLGGAGEDTETETASDESLDQDSDELDQANIDALLGGDDSSLEEAGSEESEDEDDQTNIDALLESAETDAPDEMTVAAEKELDEKDGAELDQTKIDAVPGSDEEDEKTVQQTETEEEAGEEDADLDIFLGGGAGDDATETDGLEIEQDEIDRLFAGLDDDDEDDLFPAEEIDFAEIIESGTEDDFMDLGADETVEGQAEDKSADEKTTAAGGQVEDQVEGEEEEHIVAQSGLPFIPESLSKTTVAAMGATLILVLGFCLYFFMPSGEDQPAIIPSTVTPEVAEQKVDTGQPVKQAAVSTNFIPVVGDMVYTMPHTGGEVPIILSGEDKDDTVLTYSVISQPQHGRLSGNAPVFTYLPDKTFPGEDRFEYSVSDGKDTSGIATILIRGPNLVQQALASPEEAKEPKVLLPEMSLVAAKDVTISTKSTSPVIIDFGKIWQDANKRPLHSKTYLDIDTSGLKGKLVPLVFGKYRYTPDPFYGGTEYIGYRFKKGGISSGDHLITLDVTLGSPPPEIRLAKLEDGYLVGQTVPLDATSSRDETRKSLEFEWNQVGGVPVQLVMMNEEGSMVSFVMPSFFYTEADAGPSFMLTARDETGKTDTLHVKVSVVSRRQAALWRGENGLIADDPPMSGRMLPWPYAD
ncbi:MAG: hypothetical protein GQ541_05440 [Desulfovibrionaceae bacterium]|nr:hypothetical protein [Desulfovibrionaceae bacterium]